MQEYYKNSEKMPEYLLFSSVLSRDSGYVRKFTHRNNHINLITSGSFELFVGDQKFHISAGDAVLLPVGVEHYHESKEGYSQIGISFCDFPTKGEIGQMIPELFSEGVKVLRHTATKRDYDELKKRMLDATALSKYFISNFVEGQVLRIIDLVRLKETSFRRAFISCLSDADIRTLDLSYVLARFHYSKTHLERLMKENFNMGIARYIRKLRLTMTCELIADTERTISDIAEMTGFFDSAHLIREFRREYGITPGKYRKAIITTRQTGGLHKG